MARRVKRSPEPPVTPLRIPKNITTVVVYGGMFDPPHSFHVDTVPRLIRERLGDEAWLLYVPAAKSPLKPRGSEASDTHRVAMLRKVVGAPHVWTDECDRARWLRSRGKERPSYTVETLRRLKTVLPRGVNLRLLIGADQAAAFHQWKSCRAVMRLADPLVMPRSPIQTRPAMARAMDAGFWTDDERRAWGERLLDHAVVPASSTEVRERLRTAHADRWRDVPVAIARYIREHGLYGWSA
jgi:nicotinate-nucleotide adenylyltransferase